MSAAQIIFGACLFVICALVSAFGIHKINEGEEKFHHIMMAIFGMSGCGLIVIPSIIHLFKVLQ